MIFRELWATTLIISSLAAATPVMESHLDQADGEAVIAQTIVTAIYGDDDRKEIFQVRNPLVRKAMSSVVMLAERADVVADSDETYILNSVRFGESLNLCRSERFFNQPRVGFCAGVLLQANIVLTAGHCLITEADCANTRMIFDMQYNDSGQLNMKVPASRVRSCKRIVKRMNRNSGLDFALVELDQSITDREPAPISASELNPGQVFMLGHPMGLPAKYSGVAEVFRETELEWIADLDSSAGNSGSPVFDKKNGELVGILTAGEDSPTKKQNPWCEASKICDRETCTGEVILKIQSILKNAEI